MSKDLEEVASFYGETAGFKKDWGNLHKKLVAERFRVLSEHFVPGLCLELGTADGEFTEYLLKAAQCFTGVVGLEGSKEFCRQCEERFKSFFPDQFRVEHTMFEDWETDLKFDTILVMHVLEHVDDPGKLLRKVSTWLAPGGVIIVNVPNAWSLHRVAGVHMGMLKDEYELHKLDQDLGHQRVYDPYSLARETGGAGLKMKAYGGLFLKPVSNSQIEKNWPDDLIDAYFKMGTAHNFKKYAAEIWTVCTNGN